MAGDSSPPEALLTVSEAASLLKTSPTTVRRRARTGELRGLQRAGEPVRFALAEVLALARRSQAPAEPTERHSCLFVREPSQRDAALLGLISEPLAAGACVILALDQAEARFDRLRAEPPVRQAHAEGRLHIYEAERVYLAGGQFDAARMFHELTRLCQELGQRGRALVLVGEMSWAARQRPGFQLVAYEAGLSRWLASQPDVSLICLYDASSFSGELALATVQAHPITYLDGVGHRGLG